MPSLTGGSEVTDNVGDMNIYRHHRQHFSLVLTEFLLKSVNLSHSPN